MSHLPLWTWQLSNNNMGVGTDLSGHFGVANIVIGSGNLQSALFGNRGISIGIESMGNVNLSNDCVMIGYRAGYLHTSGDNSIAIGSESANTNTTGSRNVSVGYRSLFSNDGGISAVSIGTNSLYTNTNVLGNIAIGDGAFELGASGQFGVAIGYQAARNATGNNIAVGSLSLYSNLVGTGNTVLGYQAGYSNLGSNNVFIGYGAAYNEIGSNKLYIANTTTATPLIYGEFDTPLVRINGNLDVTGTITGGMTLQEAYDASTPSPEILTDATNGALTLRRGSAADTDNVFEILNGIGSSRVSIDGNGLIDTLSSITADYFEHQGGPTILHGAGDPEGSQTAPVGSIFQRSNGGVNTLLYGKESGVGNTGWAAFITNAPTAMANSTISGTLLIDGQADSVQLTVQANPLQASEVFVVEDDLAADVFSVDISGNVTVAGTVDGRDLASDGTKLDGVEALADVTDEANVVSALDGATLTAVTVAGTDKVVVQDTSDSNNIKTVTAQSIADLKVTELSEDTTPVLAGDLTLNSNDITGTGNINTTGDLTITGDASIGGAVETAATVSAAGGYTWLATDHVLLKTGITASGDTVTLLASPVDGAQIYIKDQGGNCNGTDTLTISGNGNNIDGAGTKVLNSAYAGVHLVYYATANEWSVLSEI